MSDVSSFMDGSLNPLNVVGVVKHNIKFRREHPEYMDVDGVLILSGGQGSGKTLTGVQYIKKVLAAYPQAILCTNVHIKDLPEGTRVVPYDGENCIQNLENGYAGVVYFIDEGHLEFNSLESLYMNIEIMTEISQLRKQRKHFVITTQVYGRLAKQFREQVKNAVLCRCYFKVFQINRLIDGTKSVEENGKLITETTKTFCWFHSAELYDCYDTYEKIKRKNEPEKKGRRRRT